MAVTVMAVAFLPTLGDVVHNDSTTFLPPSSPSLQAARLASPFIHEGTQTRDPGGRGPDGRIGPDSAALQRLEAAIRGVAQVTGISPGRESADGGRYRGGAVLGGDGRGWGHGIRGGGGRAPRDGRRLHRPG